MNKANFFISILFLKTMNIFKNYLLVLFIIFFSFFNILKVKLKKIRKCTYVIIESKKAAIDRRSGPYIKSINLYDSINFIRIPNLNVCSFKTFIKIPNAVSFTHIERIYKNKFFLYNFFYRLFFYLNIKKILMIDDYRVVNIFSKLSKELDIYLILYMHGKITRFDKITPNLRFSKYLVWSEYFKKNILYSSPINIKNNNIVITGNPNLKKFDIQSNFLNSILILDEDYVSFKKIKQYLLEIVKLKSFKLFIKKKITRDLPNDYESFCKDNFISILNEENLSFCIKKYNINVIIAFSSTGLLEASYYGVLPIKLKDKNIEFNQFVKDGVVYEARHPKQVSNILKKRFDQRRIKRMKNIVWKGAEFKQSKLTKLLKNIF